MQENINERDSERDGDEIDTGDSTGSGAANGHRAGYIAVVGRPNVGKSTLVNALIGHKVAIVSKKPQTTRRRILGILSNEQAQILFVDTPGVHRPQQALNKHMMREVTAALEDCDAILFVVDVSEPPNKEDERVAEMILKRPAPKFLALNKSDRLDAVDVMEHTRLYESLLGEPSTRPETDKWMLTSGTRGDNLDKLRQMLIAALPAGPEFYPAEQYTDQTERMLAAEFVREQTLHFLQQEVPHAVAVSVDEYTQRNAKTVYIAATIFVERDTQKGILIGSGGQMLKKIGAEARKAIEAEVNANVFLELWVKVREKWRDDERAVAELI